MVSRARLALKTREKDEEIKRLKEEIEKLKDRYVRPSVIDEREKNFLKKNYEEGKLYLRMRLPMEENLIKKLEETRKLAEDREKRILLRNIELERKLEDQEEKANLSFTERLRPDPVNITMNIGKEAASIQI